MRRSDVRAMLRAMIKSAWTNHREVTVLVGHSLYNDLEALHLDHAPVIDTALLFSYQCVAAERFCFACHQQQHKTCSTARMDG